MSGWPVKPLGQLVEEVSERNRDMGCTDVYSVTNSQGFVPSEDYFNKKVFSKDITNYKLVRRGMFAYNPSRINVGSISWLQSKECVAVSPLYIVFRIKEENVSQRWVEYFLRSDMGLTQIRSLTSGSVRDSLKYSALERIEIPVPSKENQQEMVENIEAVDEAIDVCHALLDKAEELVKSRFIEMFGDPVTNPHNYPIYSLSDIATSRLGKMLDRKRQTGENSYPYLANYNVQWFRFELDSLNKMDFDEADRKEFELKKGDLLVCEGGEVGRCAIWNGEMEGCYFQKALHRVRCNPQYIIPEYLGYTFFWHSQYNGFSDAISGISTIAHLPGDRLKRLQIIVPPLDLQHSFADFIQLTDKSKLAIRKLLEKQELLKAKMMQEYFG